MVPGREKRFLSPNGFIARFASSPAAFAAIFFLSERSTGERAPYVESISQREALLQLVQNTYMNWYLDRRQRADDFEVSTSLVFSIECCRLIPSSDPGGLPALAKLIERHVLRLLDSPRGSSVGVASKHV
jgi:hypothetical protein